MIGDREPDDASDGGDTMLSRVETSARIASPPLRCPVPFVEPSASMRLGFELD
jgi:hypothetical protein